MMEHRGQEEGSSSSHFMAALDTLARTRTEKIEVGLKMARTQLEFIVKQIQNIIDMKQVVSAGPFLYVTIQEGTPNCHYLCRPSTITHFAQFLLLAHVSCSLSRKAASLPLVLVTPLDSANGLSVVVGVPPVDNRNRKNFMGKVILSGL
jgi:cell division control protein 45